MVHHEIVEGFDFMGDGSAKKSPELRKEIDDMASDDVDGQLEQIMSQMEEMDVMSNGSSRVQINVNVMNLGLLRPDSK